MKLGEKLSFLKHTKNHRLYFFHFLNVLTFLFAFMNEEVPDFEISKSYSINASTEQVFAALSNLSIYGDLHPLITKVEKVDSSDIGESFIVTEQPYSWLPFKINYKATVYSDANSVYYSVTEIPFSSGEIKYLVKDMGTMTEVQFNLQLSSIPIVRGILGRKMLLAQDKLMESLQEKLSVGQVK